MRQLFNPVRFVFGLSNPLRAANTARGRRAMTETEPSRMRPVRARRMTPGAPTVLEPAAALTKTSHTLLPHSQPLPLSQLLPLLQLCRSCSFCHLCSRACSTLGPSFPWKSAVTWITHEALPIKRSVQTGNPTSRVPGISVVATLSPGQRGSVCDATHPPHAHHTPHALHRTPPRPMRPHPPLDDSHSGLPPARPHSPCARSPRAPAPTSGRLPLRPTSGPAPLSVRLIAPTSLTLSTPRQRYIAGPQIHMGCQRFNKNTVIFTPNVFSTPLCTFIDLQSPILRLGDPNRSRTPSL